MRITIAGDMCGLAATQDAVWIAAARSNKGVVLRIDPKTKRVIAQIHTGTWPAALAADNAGVWAVNTAPFYKRGTLVRVDATTNRRVGRAVPLGRSPSGLAVGAGTVWVADALEGTVRRIDPVRRRVVATMSRPASARCGSRTGRENPSTSRTTRSCGEFTAGGAFGAATAAAQAGTRDDAILSLVDALANCGAAP